MGSWRLRWSILAGMIADNAPLWPGVNCRRVVKFGPALTVDGWSSLAQHLNMISRLVKVSSRAKNLCFVYTVKK